MKFRWGGTGVLRPAEAGTGGRLAGDGMSRRPAEDDHHHAEGVAGMDAKAW